MSNEADELRKLFLSKVIEDPSILTDDEKFNEVLNTLDSESEPSIKFNNNFCKLVLKCENKSTNDNPEYQKEGDSGFDLRANLTEPVWINPLERKLIPTGLFFEIPLGFEIQVRPRSGLALKNGITVLNTPGTIDSGYRGEVCIILVNLSDTPFCVNHGERIAQGVFAAVIGKQLVNIEMIDKVSPDTDRGAGGFGHTGLS
jgi:dUTP pyrophosphatase